MTTSQSVTCSPAAANLRGSAWEPRLLDRFDRPVLRLSARRLTRAPRWPLRDYSGASMRSSLLLTTTVAASLITAAPAVAADPIMPLSQVRSGMHCTGLSVVRGTTISSFDVDVIDVIDAEPGTDSARILVEASGPAVDATGIGPGFSGSPIYCPDGGVQRNIGAISEAIGDYGGKTVLATPIELMLANTVDPPRARDAGDGTAASPRAAAAIRRMRRQGTKPLAAPLTIGGVSARLGRALEQTGQRIGRPVIAVPAGPLGSFPPQTLRPGAAVSAGYSSGDLRVGAVGTVAYTDAGRVWAFGHPFEGAGARSLLLQDAYVFKVVNDPNASLTGGSYKLAVAGHDVGTLTNDALAAIVGHIGALPQTTSVLASAEDHDTGATRQVETTVADETDVDNPTGFTPLGAVAPLAVAEAAGSVMRSAPGRLTGSMCLRITFRERRKTPARFCNRYLSSSVFGGDFGGLGNPVAFSAAIDASTAISLIEGYEGRTPHVMRVSANIDVRRGERLAFLRRVKVPRRVKPGQRVRMTVTMQRIRGGNLKRHYRVRIPGGLKPGVRTLKLKGFEEQSMDEDLLSILLGISPGDGPLPDAPARLSDLIDAIGALGRWDGVELRLAGAEKRAFRDEDLVITGRARTKVRIVRR
jgi:hypothetical protein